MKFTLMGAVLACDAHQAIKRLHVFCVYTDCVALGINISINHFPARFERLGKAKYSQSFWIDSLHFALS